MESARFVYELDHGGEGEEEEEEDACFLDIYVHGARGIHNICIYAAQDVYARLALTSSPDDAPALATSCEIWMRSCARRLLDDQLLGFALVPLAAVAAADGARLAQDFSLSSTDLFHSPAGTIRLSLALHSGPPGDACPPPERAAAEPSITSEVVILEPAPPVDYARIEFPDLNAVKENDDMAVQYLPFLHLADAQAMDDDDCEMATSPREEKPASSDDGSKNASTSTTTAVSDDNRAVTRKARPDADDAATAPMSCRSPDTPTSNGGKPSSSDKEKGAAEDVFDSPPLRDIDMEAEQSAMQRQIMEMYMKSMQQFTESLSKMKLPMELDGDNGVVVQKEEKPEAEVKLQPKKDGARVFYGSRAFF
uniref:C2 domain-containing protein n=1 Tax=Oryza meridionalis TaxID=40149 RepID=A0A0E0CD26_9ORYZ